MEKNNQNHERKAEPVLCDNCETDNAYVEQSKLTVFEFTELPEASYITWGCKGCGEPITLFGNGASKEMAESVGVKYIQSEYPPEDIHQVWLEAQGYEYPKTHELTTRHEEVVRKFGSSLLAMPDDFFWDNIEDEQGKPWNSRWT